LRASETGIINGRCCCAAGLFWVFTDRVTLGFRLKETEGLLDALRPAPKCWPGLADRLQMAYQRAAPA
jgi:hypothetical protein